MTKLETPKQVKGLGWMLSVTYMISYMTRNNYGAIISEIEAATPMSKTMLSMALTGAFVAYGIGQIVSGVCGDRFFPKKLVSYGLLVTTAMNFLIPLCTNPYQMLAVWSVNGFAQAFMWPPFVKIMTGLLSAEDYKQATVKVSWGSSFGTMAVYLLSPLLILLLGWGAVFVFCGLCGLIMFFIWNKKGYDVDVTRIKTDNQTEMKHGLLFTPLILCIIVAIVIQGAMRDGVTTWMPSYIAETYQLSSVMAILTGVALPIFGILCVRLAMILHRKLFTNPILCAGVIFGAGMPAALLLWLLSGKNPGYSVLFSAILCGCMHGVNLMLICVVPSFFEKYGNVSTVSGILNSCTYMGSAVSTYGIALLTESRGWNDTLLLWLILTGLGTALCIICSGPWAAKFGGGSKNRGRQIFAVNGEKD